MTKELKNQEISIGWDVGGWSGKNHGLCILKSKNENIEVLHAASINVYDVKATIQETVNRYSEQAKITLAIDAPLQFPKLFKQLILANEGLYMEKIKSTPKKNPLAWRGTDLFIKEKFGKTPLSASFSFLTSNATVAIALLGELKALFPELAVLPFDPIGNFRCLEVYPGLLKSLPLQQTKSFQLYKSLTSSVHFTKVNGFDYYFKAATEKTDTADSVICALYGLGISSGIPAVPQLEMKIPESEINHAKEEGWIYFPA